jgi:hypothetical protein
LLVLATSGTVVLKTTSATGTTLFQGDVPAGDIINFSFPEDGILFPKGVLFLLLLLEQ